MKILLKRCLHYLLPCFNGDRPNIMIDGNSQSSFPFPASSETIQMQLWNISSNNLSSSSSLSMASNSSLQTQLHPVTQAQIMCANPVPIPSPIPNPIHIPCPIHIPTPTPVPTPCLSNSNLMDGDLFLVNNPSLYNKIRESFINFHGSGSDKAKALISPEIDLADRAFNIHCITGGGHSGHIPFHFHHTLKNKSSFSSMLSEYGTINTISSDSPSGPWTTATNLLDHSVSYADGVKIALELIS